MLDLCAQALKNATWRLGARISFPDRDNFGRTAMVLPPEAVYAQTLCTNRRAGGDCRGRKAA